MSSSVPSFSFLKAYSYDSLTVPVALQAGSPVVKQQQSQLPAWKISWDKARVQARAGDLASAVRLYQQLLANKDVQEARWEMANVLAQLGEIKEAYTLVELLFEGDTARDDYLSSLAVLSLKLAQYERSAQLFAQLSSRQSDNMNALAGAAYSYLAVSDRPAALPFLEKMMLKDSKNIELRKTLAFIAFDLKEDAKALTHLVELAAQDNSQKEILLKAAQLHDRLGFPDKAAMYWQRLQSLDNNHLDANDRLASYYQETGKVAKALPHLLILWEKNPKEPKLLRRIGQCYVGMQEFTQALTYFEQYVAIMPGDKVAVKFIANIHAALGHKEQTLQALEHYFLIESKPDKAKLKKAAKLYDEKGFYYEAIGIYRRLLEMSPDDPEILVSLANSFLEVGDEEDALKVWGKLAGLAPGVVEVYRPMVGLLERLGRDQELTRVLEVIHGLDPSDQSVAIQLIGKYFESGEYVKSEALIDQYASSSELLPDFNFWRGSINFKQGELTQAIDDLELFLEMAPNRIDARMLCLTAAGRQGDLVRVKRHHGVIRQAGVPLSLEKELQIGQAMQRAGASQESRVIYDKIIDQAFTGSDRIGQGQIDLVVQTIISASESFVEENLFYEAEQILRVGLVVADPSVFLPYLFDIALAKGNVDDAGLWLDYYKRGVPDTDTAQHLREIRLRVAKGEMWRANRLIRAVMQSFLATDRREAGVGSVSPAMLRSQVGLAGFLQTIGQYEEAEELSVSILASDPSQVEAKVILEKLAWLTGESQLGRIDTAEMEPWELLELVELYEKHTSYQQMEKVARLLLSRIPGSLRAGLMITNALSQQGKLNDAAALLTDLNAEYPGNHDIQFRLQKLVFQTGDLVKAMELNQKFSAFDQRQDILLLQARILWRQNKWAEAIDKYKEILDPTVVDLLRTKGQALHFKLPVSKRDRSFWEKIGLTPERDSGLELAEQIMSVPYFMQLIDDNMTFSLSAARFFAQACWQGQAAAELRVCNLVKKREYIQAEKAYEALLVEYPHERSLFYDLARIYNRLGKFGEEAASYEELLADNPDSIELQEALARNQIQQQPRVSFAAGHSKEEGRNDYKDIEKDWQQLSFWYAPQTRQEASLKLARNNYGSITRNAVVRSTRAYAAYKANWSSISMKLGGGIESLDTGGANAALFDFEAEGKLGDRLVSSIAFGRDLVADTTASLSRELIQQKFRAGLAMDPLTRLTLGGAYEVRDYSDNNWTSGYDLWSSYILFSEPTFLKIFYSYDFKESREGRESGTPLADGFAADDHPYWAPKNYWSNQFGAYFKHYFSQDALGRGIPKYYTVEYALGHDSDGYGMQSFNGSLYMELHPRFLIEASSEIKSSPNYRKKYFLLSASYRW